MNVAATPTNSTKNLLAWLALIAAFLYAGITGHDPWKQDETYSFGIIYHFYVTHTWLVPVNAGVAFMEKPPLYYWTAVVFCKLFSGVLPLHDAARLTSFLYMCVTVFFSWKCSQVLFREYAERSSMSWIAVALLLGSLGLVRHAHDMFTDVALLAGTTIALFGMSENIGPENACKSSGFWMGLGVGIAFLSKGLLIPVILSASFLIVWAIVGKIRMRQTWLTVAMALVVAAPFLFVWPLLLYLHSKALFLQWFWENNVGRFLGFSVQHLGADNKPFYLLYTLLWFAFPAFPLACVTLIKKWRDWRRAEYLLPATITLGGMILMLASASARALYLIPLMPAIAMLAAPAMLILSSRFLLIWNIIIGSIFSIFTILILLTWWSLLHPANDQPIALFSAIISQWLPLGFVAPNTQILAYVITISILCLWFIVLRSNLRLPENTAYIWLCGVALLWCTSHTLLLPWINETKSYCPVFERLNKVIEQSADHHCIENYNLGESIGPMFEYFDAQYPLVLTHDPNEASCPLLLTSNVKTMTEDLGPHWQIVWKGSRILDVKDEEIRLYTAKGYAKNP